MNLPISAVFLIIFSVVCGSSVQAQTRRPSNQKTQIVSAKQPEIGQKAVVIDETLSVLRSQPSLFSDAIQRMRRGRKIQILATREADGVRFYRVTAPPASTGWVQADSVFGRFRPDDERRLASLVQASSGFDQIELAVQFFELYPDSQLKPSILLLFGDLLEESAARLSRDAGSRLSRKEMAASGAPLHSFFLNFVSLDRYRKLGINYRFNTATRQYHYDGASWKEIVSKYPSAPEVPEAGKRLYALRSKLETTTESAR